eukprot:jgi/Chrzof1/3090/Cz12g11110.t1
MLTCRAVRCSVVCSVTCCQCGVLDAPLSCSPTTYSVSWTWMVLLLSSHSLTARPQGYATTCRTSQFSYFDLPHLGDKHACRCWEI